MTQFYKYNNHAGIYKWQNKINGKCYIGQSINLGLRLRHHTYAYNHDRFSSPLYKAFKKYGIENFSVEILYDVANPMPQVKSLLDRLEVGYIEKYNSYGHTGYNQTRGGDGSLIGFKFTDAEKLARSKRMKEYIAIHGVMNVGIAKPVFVYDIDSKWIIKFPSRKSASSSLNVCLNNIYTSCSKENKIANKKFICANTESELLCRIDNYDQ